MKDYRFQLLFPCLVFDVVHGAGKVWALSDRQRTIWDVGEGWLRSD